MGHGVKKVEKSYFHTFFLKSNCSTSLEKSSLKNNEASKPILFFRIREIFKSFRYIYVIQLQLAELCIETRAFRLKTN